MRVRPLPGRLARVATAMLAVLAAGPVGAADVYRYQDDTGRWVFSDRQPAPGMDYEVETLDPAGPDAPAVTLVREAFDGRQRLLARNGCHCPVQVAVSLTALVNAAGVAGDRAVVVVPARAERELMQVAPLRQDRAWSFDYEYGFVFGDPAARHAPEAPYRLPFAAAQAFVVSQAAPDRVTHDTPDSEHAVDFAMPVGTGVYAARAGIVVEVAWANFRGGQDRAAFGARANLVRILHDDGTFAVYAHLRRESVRVRPGQAVTRGELVGASGDTGFSTGPHLHFAVIRNAGLRTVSVPVRFDDGAGGSLVARTGARLANP